MEPSNSGRTLSPFGADLTSPDTPLQRSFTVCGDTDMPAYVDPVVVAAAATISPSRRAAAQHKPRPEPLDLPPIADSSAFVVPEAEQVQQRQQHHLHPVENSASRASPMAPATDAAAQPPDTAPQPTSTSSNGAGRQFHSAHKKAPKSCVDMWFEYMIALSEVVFVSKLSLYEESCALLLAHAAPRKGKSSRASLCRSEKIALDILERMQLRRPVKMRKQTGLLDAIEEEKEYVYEGLEEGYKVVDVDVDAVRHYGHRNGWLPPSHPESHHDTPLAQPRHALCSVVNAADVETDAAVTPSALSTTQDPPSALHRALADVHGAEVSPKGATVASSSPPVSPPFASSSLSPLSGAEDKAAEEGATQEIIEQTLLYGELTSLGVRQVARVFHEAVLHDSAEDLYSQDYGTVVVGVDIGCGTGKMLFEWSRLATAQVQIDNAEKTPMDASVVSNFPIAASGTSEVPTALQYARHGGSWRGLTACQPCGGSPAAPLNTRRQQHYISRMPADLAPPQDWSFSSLGAATAPAPQAQAQVRSNLRGFLGVGIEVAPSRMFVARKAMSPNYLDLILSNPKRGSHDDSSPKKASGRSNPAFAGPREAFAVGDLNSAEEAKKLVRHHVSVATARSLLPRYDPAPASAVAAPCPDPAKRRPAACVLLHEGDVLSPGLLHNQTLFRFPPPNVLYHSNLSSARAPASALAVPHDSGSFGAALSLGGMAAGIPSAMRATHAPARENYYRLCRVQRGPTPSGHEVPHLNIFCCGIGFDEPFVRALCTAIEGLLQPLPPDEPHTATTAAEVMPLGVGLAGALEGPRSLNHTMAPPPAASSVTATNHANVFFPKLLRPSALEHWKSITCVLLLRDFDVEETLKQPDFPLFCCCRRWHVSTRHAGATESTTSGERSAASTPMPQFALPGVGEGGLVGMPEALCEYEDRSMNVPSWCTTRASLRDSSIRLTYLETTWMTKAPAWVLNFRF